MNTYRIFALTLIAAATLAGCSSLPASNPSLEQARSDYRAAQDNAQTRNLAGGELKLAGDALTKADKAWSDGDKTAEVDHLAYLAKQRVAIAQETAKQKAAELAVGNADIARDKIRLAARTNEADAAKQSAEMAQRQAEESQRQAEAAKQQADASQRQTAAAQQQAEATRQLASDAQARNIALEAQLKDLNATKTDRGMVVTIGDVLFDTNKAELKSGGMRSVEKLSAFLKQYPQRKALIEGFTDSVGSEGSNQGLSSRRADSVRTAIVDMGVGADRLATHGYGEAYPVAGNENAAGRQLNRRVEIILSDDNGIVAPR
jgi:outer membrane protein OmpA-like peptidoglycan-associated protein